MHIDEITKEAVLFAVPSVRLLIMNTLVARLLMITDNTYHFSVESGDGDALSLSVLMWQSFS